MYARVSTYEGPANLTEEQVAEITRQQEEAILPRVRSMEGFKGVITLMEPASGRAISVTLWETEQAMTASEDEANRLREESASLASEEIRTVERYQVGIFAMT